MRAATGPADPVQIAALARAGAGQGWVSSTGPLASQKAPVGGCKTHRPLAPQKLGPETLRFALAVCWCVRSPEGSSCPTAHPRLILLPCGPVEEERPDV